MRSSSSVRDWTQKASRPFSSLAFSRLCFVPSSSSVKAPTLVCDCPAPFSDAICLNYEKKAIKYGPHYVIVLDNQILFNGVATVMDCCLKQRCKIELLDVVSLFSQ